MCRKVNDKELGHTLAVLRISKGLSLDDVKEKTSLFIDQINEIESGKNISSDTVNRILDIYGLELQGTAAEKIDKKHEHRHFFPSFFSKLFKRDRTTDKSEEEAEDVLNDVLNSLGDDETGELIVPEGEITEALKSDYEILSTFETITITSIPNSTRLAEVTRAKFDKLKSIDPLAHKWEFYTDGSCLDSGKGSWAFVLLCDGMPVLKRSGFQKQQSTSTIMEYTAVAYALKTAVDFKIKDINIYTDCKPIIETLTNEDGCCNSKNIKLCELVSTIKENRGMFNSFNIEWIPGHAGNKWNVIADKLANQELANRRLVRG